MARTADFVKQVVSSMLYRPDGTVEMTRDPAVWTLAHRGYSGCGRLDVWAYRIPRGTCCGFRPRSCNWTATNRVTAEGLAVTGGG